MNGLGICVRAEEIHAISLGDDFQSSFDLCGRVIKESGEIRTCLLRLPEDGMPLIKLSKNPEVPDAPVACSSMAASPQALEKSGGCGLWISTCDEWDSTAV